MKISTRGRYAVRLMLDLALHSDSLVKLKDIAERQKLSDKYLEQIIAILNKANFVKSVRGANGGYSLTQNPDKYTVGDILRVVEGSLAPVECLCENADKCLLENSCTTVKVWKELYKAINDVVDKYTLKDLVEISQNDNPMLDYVI